MPESELQGTKKSCHFYPELWEEVHRFWFKHRFLNLSQAIRALVRGGLSATWLPLPEDPPAQRPIREKGRDYKVAYNRNQASCVFEPELFTAVQDVQALRGGDWNKAIIALVRRGLVAYETGALPVPEPESRERDGKLQEFRRNWKHPKPVPLYFSVEMLSEIDEYRFTQGLASRQDAVRALIRSGLERHQRRSARQAAS